MTQAGIRKINERTNWRQEWIQTKQFETNDTNKTATSSISVTAMVRGDLEEISLNGQGVELELSDSDASPVNSGMNDAVVAEGQEALWIEDDMSEMFSNGAPGKKETASKKKKFNRLFRGKKKKTIKSVVLLPQANIDRSPQHEDSEESEESPVDDRMEADCEIQREDLEEAREDVELMELPPVDETEENSSEVETAIQEQVETVEDAQESVVAAGVTAGEVETGSDLQESPEKDTEEIIKQIEEIEEISSAVVGQEALWVEDLDKKKKFHLPFRGKTKKSKKTVVLLPQASMEKMADDEIAREDQQTPVESTPEATATSVAVAEKNMEKTQEPQEQEEIEKENQDIPLEEDKETEEDHSVRQIEDSMKEIKETPMAVEAEDIAELEETPSDDVSSLGLKTDTYEYVQEYGVEVAEKSATGNKTVEIVGIGSMIMEAETIKEEGQEESEVASPEESEVASSKQKKTKTGFFGLFQSKPKNCNTRKHGEKELSETADSNLGDVSANDSGNEVASLSPNSVEMKPDPADRYSVAPVDLKRNGETSETNKNSLVPSAPDGENEDRFEEEPKTSEELSINMIDDQEEDEDDRYRIGPPKRSEELHDDGDSYEPRATIMNPYRDGVQNDDQSLLTTQEVTRKDIWIKEGKESNDSVATAKDEANAAERFDAAMVNDKPDGETIHSSSDKSAEYSEPVKEAPTSKASKTEKRKNRLAGLFGGQKNKKLQNARKIERTSKASSRVSSKEAVESTSGSKSDQRSKVSSASKSSVVEDERSIPSSVKGDSMTVIVQAINKGSLMAQESNLEAEASLKSRRLRPNVIGSEKDVIDLIKERTRKNNGKRLDPIDSTTSAIRKSVSKDPAGKEVALPKKSSGADAPKAKILKKFMSQAPTPRAKKVVEPTEQNPPESKVSHQRQITQRLYGTPKGTGQLMSSKNVYIGDLLNAMPGGASTDPTVDSAVSAEKDEVRKEQNASSIMGN